MNTVAAAWKIYRNEPLTVRLHIAVRAAVCPFEDILPFFPAAGTILDLGCGYGLLSHLLRLNPPNNGRLIMGIDHDASKIKRAMRYAQDGLSFFTTGISSIPENAYDAVSVVDVLYSVPLGNWQEVFDHCYRVLKPGGVLIAKESVDSPRWKYWIVMAEETIAVEILRITKGTKPHLESVKTYRNAIEQSGFVLTEERPLRHWSWDTHHLFVAQKRS